MTIVALSNLTASRRRRSPPLPSRAFLASGAVLAALIVGVGGEWLDFRALRVPILLVVGICVLAAACSFSPRGGVGDFVRTSLVGAATWGTGGVLYAIIHVARGESFDASRFGPQWSQALGLIAVHALLLGLPTGIAVASAMQAYRWRREQSPPFDAAPVVDGA
jgi:hypothetical protein